MKTILSSLFLVLALTQVQAKLLKAYLIMPDETFSTIFLESADDRRVSYRETERSVERKIILQSKYSSLYLFEPVEFREAIDQFRLGNYEEALIIFKQIQEDFKNLRDLPNNFASRAEFYECECLRLQGDITGALEKKNTYRFKGLTYDNETRQLGLYKYWEALRDKSWNRLKLLGAEAMEKPMPGVEKAQIAYCYGVALGELKELNPALNAFGSAVTADASPRKEISRLALLKSLELLEADPEFQREKSNWGTDDAIEGSVGQARLVEAARIAKYYQSIFKTSRELPSEYKELRKFLPADEAGE